MKPKEILGQLNISKQCKKYGLPLWQCPQFLFLIMGMFVILSSLVSYLIGSRYIAEPSLVALIVIFITAVLFIIAFIITNNFERLAEVARMKSEVVNIVTHQLRAPLTNLKWTIDVLTAKDWERSPEKEEDYYSSLKENTGRMVELVEDLLIVSRIEQGTVPLRKKETSFADLIGDLVSRYKAFSEASNIKIEFYPQENLPLIFIDPSQIKLVVENLLDNAIRYIKGGGKIEIRLGKRDKNFYFEIKDSGVGIPVADQKHIFQKFFRSENVMRDQTRGSGLGLYITKSIIEKSGGKIWFKSKEGKGTTFYFTLPIK